MQKSSDIAKKKLQRLIVISNVVGWISPLATVGAIFYYALSGMSSAAGGFFVPLVIVFACIMTAPFCLVVVILIIRRLIIGRKRRKNNIKLSPSQIAGIISGMLLCALPLMLVIVMFIIMPLVHRI